MGEAASVLGVSITTLRRWEASGKLAAEHTAGGHLEIITVFSARLYGSRSSKNQKLLDGVKKALEESQC